MFSTLGDVQYIKGYSVHWGDIMSTSGDTMSTSGDIMSTSGDIMSTSGVFSTSGGYHEYIGGCSVHWVMFSTSGFSIEIEMILSSCSPTCIMISPNVLMISLDVLMVSPHIHHDIPRCTEPEHPAM